MKQAKLPKPTTVDFETLEIRDRPHYPPSPVGVSIRKWGKKARYYAWGHPTGNNCTWAEAKKALEEAWRSADGVLFQNGKFDVDVGEVEFDLPRLDWTKYHDTLYLLFLDDPHQKELGLKPSAFRLLDLPPEEQDAVADWLIEHQPIPGTKISKSRSSDHYFGRYIAYAPGDLVGDYADGDALRTEKVFDKLYPLILNRSMGPAYDRERQLMPILLEIERQGVSVGLKKLRDDVKFYQEWQNKIDAWIRKTIKAPADINLNSAPQLIAAMVKVGKCDVDLLGETPSSTPEKPRYKTDKDSLMDAVTDRVLLAMLKYRSQLNTCLNTFMKNWLEMAENSGGCIFTSWNQIRSQDAGARTGRLSSTPNFQNIPKEFAPIFHHEDPKKKLPKCPLVGMPSLPLVRSYVVPWAKDHVLIDRDYSQQELRILGHFEGGKLAEAYQADPWLDVHDFAREMINRMTGKDFDRKPIKNTGFGLIYGMGIGKLAIKSECSVDVAKEVKTAYLKIFPGLKDMYKDMKYRSQANLPIHTWGSREYYCEEPRLVDGRLMTFDYKMLNVLIQGSAADCTKEAVIRYWALKAKDPAAKEDRLLLTVHDEILLSAPRKRAKQAMELLRKAMEGIDFEVPMLSEGDWSATCWSELIPYDKKGVVVATI